MFKAPVHSRHSAFALKLTCWGMTMNSSLNVIAMSQQCTDNLNNIIQSNIPLENGQTSCITIRPIIPSTPQKQLF